MQLRKFVLALNVNELSLGDKICSSTPNFAILALFSEAQRNSGVLAEGTGWTALLEKTMKSQCFFSFSLQRVALNHPYSPETKLWILSP